MSCGLLSRKMGVRSQPELLLLGLRLSVMHSSGVWVTGESSCWEMATTPLSCRRLLSSHGSLPAQGSSPCCSRLRMQDLPRNGFGWRLFNPTLHTHSHTHVGWPKQAGVHQETLGQWRPRQKLWKPSSCIQYLGLYSAHLPCTCLLIVNLINLSSKNRESVLFHSQSWGNSKGKWKTTQPVDIYVWPIWCFCLEEEFVIIIIFKLFIFNIKMYIQNMFTIIKHRAQWLCFSQHPQKGPETDQQQCSGAPRTLFHLLPALLTPRAWNSFSYF